MISVCWDEKPPPAVWSAFIASVLRSLHEGELANQSDGKASFSGKFEKKKKKSNHEFHLKQTSTKTHYYLPPFYITPLMNKCNFCNAWGSHSISDMHNWYRVLYLNSAPCQIIPSAVEREGGGLGLFEHRSSKALKTWGIISELTSPLHSMWLCKMWEAEDCSKYVGNLLCSWWETQSDRFTWQEK